MIRTGFIATAIAFASLGAAPQIASAQSFSLQIGVPPPPLRYEVVPQPRRHHIWVPGHWQWNGYQHVWVVGHWERERPGYYYTQPAWVQVGSGWEYRAGGWGDRDRDGIPNRYDRYDNRRGAYGRGDRDRDGVPNRFDRDRDGDGVPNRFDRRPDNPNRR